MGCESALSGVKMCSLLKKKREGLGVPPRPHEPTNRGHMITMHRRLFFLGFETKQAGKYVSTQVSDNFIAFSNAPL